MTAHRRALRQYGLQSVLQVLRRPSRQHLLLLARLAARPDLMRAMLPLRRRTAAGD
jgi:hypothetical protein